jgi:hypothetical protein
MRVSGLLPARFYKGASEFLCHLYKIVCPLPSLQYGLRSHFTDAVTQDRAFREIALCSSTRCTKITSNV